MNDEALNSLSLFLARSRLIRTFKCTNLKLRDKHLRTLLSFLEEHPFPLDLLEFVSFVFFHFLFDLSFRSLVCPGTCSPPQEPST